MGLSVSGESQPQHSATLLSPCGGGERAGTPATASASEASATGYRCSPGSPSLGSQPLAPWGSAGRGLSGATGRGTLWVRQGLSQRHWARAVVSATPRQEPAVMGAGSSRPDYPAPPGRVAPAAEGSKSPGTQGHAWPRHPQGVAPAGAGPGRAGLGGARRQGRPRGSARLKGRRRRGGGDSAAGRAGSGLWGPALRSGKLGSAFRTPWVPPRPRQG